MPGHPPNPRPSRVRCAIAAVVMAVGVFAIGCSSGSGTSVAPTSTTESVPAIRVPTFTDPALPVTAEVGHQFSIMLPADPGSGWRWVLAPVDTALLVPLGSEFSDDPDLASQTSPSVTAYPTTTAYITTTTSPDETTTTTTAILPLTQMVSFAAKAPGTTAVMFRYEQIGTTTATTEQPRTATFTVTIMPAAPTTSTTR